MYEDLVLRLEDLGFEPGGADRRHLEFSLSAVLDMFKAETGLSEVPPELCCAAIDMAAGRFLQELKANSPDRAFGAGNIAAIKQISEGDTSVTFEVGGSETPESRLDDLIASLLQEGKTRFASFRRL